MNRTALLLLPSLLAGCVINGDEYKRPFELEPAWLVNRPRLLAVTPEPPEANPGDTVTFQALLADPTDEIEGVLWLACPPELSFGSGCAVDFENVDFEDPQSLVDAGVIGFEPGLPPRLDIPDDALAGLPEDEARQGVYWMVQLMGLPQTDPEAAPEDADADRLDFAAIESGHKRLVVSSSEAPNANPQIVLFTVDGMDLPLDAVVELDAGQSYEFGVVLDEDSREVYDYLNPEGQLEQRTEEPYLKWYATDGELGADTSIDPYLYTQWIAPESGAEGSLWAVVRDRRGGMSWLEQRWRVR